MPAAQDLRIQHARRGVVVGIETFSRHLQHGITSGKTLADHAVTHAWSLLAMTLMRALPWRVALAAATGHPEAWPPPTEWPGRFLRTRCSGRGCRQCPL